MDDRTKNLLSVAIAADAKTLFSHVPESDIMEDERIEFTLAEGRLSVWVKRTGYTYTLFDGCVWRYKSREFGRVEVDIFENRRSTETIIMQMDGKGNFTICA